MVKPRRSVIALGVAVAAVALMGAVAANLNASRARPTSRNAVAVAIPGKIARLVVADGEIVKRGQLLAELDMTAAQAELAKAEAELKQVRQEAQAAILPLPPLAGLTGFLPPPSKPVTVRTPVESADSAPPAPVVKQPRKPTAFEIEESAHREASGAVDLASARLNAAQTELDTAQTVRDALRPKQAEADASLTRAENKAEAADDLLAEGAISKKEAADIVAKRGAAQASVDDLGRQARAADGAIAAARTSLDAAKSALTQALADLKASESRLALAAIKRDETPKPSAKPPAPPKVVKYETKLVTKRPPVVEALPPPPTPVKVLVDAKAIGASTAKIADLQKKIAALRARIDAAKVLAPIAGQVQIGPDGSLSILPLGG